MKEATQSEPPPDWKRPSGLCECGCGERTKIATLTALSRGHYKGHPLRFIHGHHTRLLRPEQTSRWKGGRYLDSAGYVQVFVGAGRYRGEHVLIWEKKHGPIPRGWIVHHINHVRTDNRLSNLLAMTRSQHTKLHEEHNRAHQTGHYAKH